MLPSCWPVVLLYHNSRRATEICDQICDNWPLPVIIDFVLEAKINTKPTFGRSLENWLSINYYPLPTSWLHALVLPCIALSFTNSCRHWSHTTETRSHDADVAMAMNVSGSTQRVSVGSSILFPNTTDTSLFPWEDSRIAGSNRWSLQRVSWLSVGVSLQLCDHDSLQNCCSTRLAINAQQKCVHLWAMW